MEFLILGPLEVREAGHALALPGARQRAVLALLVLHVDEVVSRDRMIEELWGHNPPATAAATIQVYVSRLRKVLPASTLVTQAPGYRLRVKPEQVDARRFELRLREGTRAQADGDAETAAKVLREALGLWRGPTLADFAYESFAQAEIARLEELRLAALEARIEADLDLGRQRELVGELEALIAGHPLRERLRGLHMLALYRCGRQADALAAYRDARAVLVEELGIEPSPVLQRLERDILAQDPELERGPPGMETKVPSAAIPDFPSGTVTFLHSDIEGSTRLLHELGSASFADALAEHRRIMRQAFDANGGVEMSTEGDSFWAVFPTAPGAFAAAQQAQQALAGGPIAVRMALHTGTPLLTPDGYVGPDLHRAARIAACGHGGQVLVSSSTASLLGTDCLRDLGEHRLKDLDEPERIYQVGDTDFPPIRSLHHANLPVPSTQFIGRERELSEVTTLLAQEAVRVLTLTGPGGSGKTRLALQAASRLAERYRDGVFWVALAPLRDPRLVLEMAAKAVGAGDSLAEHVADRSLLLLFDNFEQVVEATTDLADLLTACPHLDLLVTSRQALHIRGEHEVPVPPLEHGDAIELFLARARAVKPDFHADQDVSEICRRLDDLPLTLELAAARARALTARQILDRLERRLPLLTGGARDLPERQRTLRATMEWSYNLLDDEERRLFARLAVFRGGCALEAAEQVSDADLDVLQSLVDKSLLRHAGERFWMLETIREYASERLEESGEQEALRDRHLDWALAVAEQAYADRLTSAATWFPILDAEHDNVRAALDWADDRRPAAGTALAGAVAPYWLLQGHPREARERITGALRGHQSRDRIRARALMHLGEMEGAAPEALGHLTESLTLWREQGDALGEALALNGIGYAHLYAGDYGPAKLAFEESLALRARSGAHELECAGALGGLCHLLVASAEIERAESVARELYELGARHGNVDVQSDGLHYLADCPLLGGDYVEAEKRYVRALAHARASGIVSQCQAELYGVAMSAAGQGDHARAVRLAAAAGAQREAMGLGTLSPAHWWRKLQDRHIGAARAHLTTDELEAAEGAGRDAPFDAVLDEVLAAQAATTPVAGHAASA